MCVERERVSVCVCVCVCVCVSLSVCERERSEPIRSPRIDKQSLRAYKAGEDLWTHSVLFLHKSIRRPRPDFSCSVSFLKKRVAQKPETFRCQNERNPNTHKHSANTLQPSLVHRNMKSPSSFTHLYVFAFFPILNTKGDIWPWSTKPVIRSILWNWDLYIIINHLNK